MPSALVTGATGLVGSYIVERLVADGWHVRALVRGDASDLEQQGVECIRGDVLDREQFVRAAHARDVVFHTAAAITQRGDWEVYRRLNIDGTRNAIDAAERAGARLLQLSSVAVYSSRYAGDSAKTDETAHLGPLPERAYYARSKRESEELVMAAHHAGRIWAAAVRPCVIYGRRDRQFVPRLARLLRFGVAPLIGGGRSTIPVVHAANVADGAIRAATTTEAGGRAYNLANDFSVSVRAFVELAARGLARRVHFVPIPLGVARGVFSVALRTIRIASGGRASLVTDDSLSMITRDNPYDSSRAYRELGWAPSLRPEDGVPDAFRWWRERVRG